MTTARRLAAILVADVKERGHARSMIAEHNFAPGNAATSSGTTSWGRPSWSSSTSPRADDELRLREAH